MVSQNLDIDKNELNNNKITNRINYPYKVQDHLINKEYIKTKYKTPFMLFHQNIRSLHGKTDELLSLWVKEFPHILCFTEHHLREHEFNSLCCHPYKLAAKYCRDNSEFGGVCIYTHESV
jgi:hypothetical protein